MDTESDCIVLEDEEEWNVFFGPRSICRRRGRLAKWDMEAKTIDPFFLLRSDAEEDLRVARSREGKEKDKRKDGAPTGFESWKRHLRKKNDEEETMDDKYALGLKRLFGSETDGTVVNVVLEPERSIDPKGSYSKITNHVVTVHYRRPGEELYVDGRRIPLYLPYSQRNEKFAAVIMPMGGATVLFFANGKVVITGKVTVSGALFGLHMCRIKLGKIPQPVIYKWKDPNDPKGGYRREMRLGYLKTILGFSRFAVQNIVGSGPLVSPGETVNLAALHKSYPETSWDPEIFPGLKFHLCHGNDTLKGGFKCTAHIFEGKIVIMAPKTAEKVKIAYDHFLNVVRPFVVESSPEYMANRYKYRYNQMMAMHDRIATPPRLSSSVRPQSKSAGASTPKKLEESIKGKERAPYSLDAKKEELERLHGNLFGGKLLPRLVVSDSISDPLSSTRERGEEEEEEKGVTVEEPGCGANTRNKKRKATDISDGGRKGDPSFSAPTVGKKDSILNFDFLSYLSEDDMRSVNASIQIAKKMRSSGSKSNFGSRNNNSSNDANSEIGSRGGRATVI